MEGVSSGERVSPGFVQQPRNTKFNQTEKTVIAIPAVAVFFCLFRGKEKSYECHHKVVFSVIPAPEPIIEEIPTERIDIQKKQARRKKVKVDENQLSLFDLVA